MIDENGDMPTGRPNTDGRVARGERTRQAIVAAHTELLREGVLKPTGKQIAEKAGVSLRTLWLNFGDTEGLLGATTSYWLTADKELWHPIDPGLPLAERIQSFCAQRVQRLESIAPAARAARLGEPFSPALQTSRRSHFVRVRSEIEAVFAAELEAAGPRREELLRGLVVVVGWPAWEMLRVDFGVDAEQGAAVMRQSVGVFLGAVPPAAG